METDQIHTFLTQWINKAVTNGGFNAQEARDALGAVDLLAEKAKQNENGKQAKPAPGPKK